MPNEKHLALLESGVHAWNEARADKIGLLHDLKVTGDLSRPDLSRADLSGANLANLDLSGANLSGANLSRANLQYARLQSAILPEARLSGANLREANLFDAALIKADLSEADLSGADLAYTRIQGSRLSAAQFHRVRFHNTVIASVDLSEVLGLAEVRHHGPSSLSVDTLYQSSGRIPEAFLRGCGVPDEFIAYLPSLVGVEQAIRFNSCFISYSTKDDEFASRLYQRLRAEHVRVWFAPEELKGGKKLSEQIERGVELHDRLLLVLSEHSIGSPWVIREIRKARRQEVNEKRRKLFPIMLCDYGTLTEWRAEDSVTGTDLAEEIRQYYIPDFSRWKDHDEFESEFAKLLRDLRAEDERQAKSGTS